MIASITATDPSLQRYSNIPSSSIANNTDAEKRGGEEKEKAIQHKSTITKVPYLP
jgi:hypothetical protein